MAILKNQDEQLYDVWNKCWKGSVQKERLTFLGRLMFKAKRRTLQKVVKDFKFDAVLEAGCGLGYTMQVFHDAGLECVGIDVSPHAVAICKNKGLRVALKKVEEVTEQYDLVSSDGMLEHFLNFELYAKHFMRISRRYVLLIQPNHGSFLGKIFVLLSEIFRKNENVFEYNYRIIDYITVFEKGGFPILRNEPIFFDVFRLLLFKR